MSRKRPIPHSLKLKHRYAKTAGSLINMLPINQQLHSTQGSLGQLIGVWQQWCSELSRIKYQLGQHARLESFDRGVLHICTAQASTATLIKHQTSSLLAAFHSRGFDHIQRIVVRIELPTQSLLKSSRITSKTHPRKAQRPSKESISAVESAADDANGDALSEALHRLAGTLSKL